MNSAPRRAAGTARALALAAALAPLLVAVPAAPAAANAPADSAATAAASARPPSAVVTALTEARLAGEGILRWFGLKIYEARLWIGAEGLEPARFASKPFALDLRYSRSLKGDSIARTSHEEIERLGFGDPGRRDAWLEAMRGIFPDVREGDRITGVNRPGRGVSFYRNDRSIGSIDDPEFAPAFFAIWLDPRTIAPGLREQLLARIDARPGAPR